MVFYTDNYVFLFLYRAFEVSFWYGIKFEVCVYQRQKSFLLVVIFGIILIVVG